MPRLQRLRAFLDSRGARYSISAHPVAFRAFEMASVEHLPAREVAKTVVVFGDGQFYMLVVPANREVDLAGVKQALELKHVRLATEAELIQLFPDCEVGAMPPIGALYDIPVCLDAELAKEDMISFPAGNHQESVHMHMGDFRRLNEHRVMSLARAQFAGFGW